MTATENRKPKLGFKQLAEKLRQDIETNKLSYGAPLPPSRSMAEQLGVSRDTVVSAYNVLENQGYIESDGRRGTFVSFKSDLKLPRTSTESELLSLSKIGKSLLSHTKAQRTASPNPDELTSFNFGAVPREALPLRQWRELLLKRVQSTKNLSLEYTPNVFGREEFRDALAQYLAYTKGIRAQKEEIAVFNISITAVDILLTLLMESGDCIAIEDPGYPAIEQLAHKHQLSIATLPVDDKGAQVEFLAALNPKPKLIYVTPDSHDPTGTTLSLNRRLELLAWANANNAWIIEDAFDGFFRYGEAAPPALKALDTEGRVLYLSTFWQVLYPLATTSYLLMPPNIATVFRAAKALTDGIAETMPQLILADMLKSGFLNGHTRRWNKIFAARRRTLIFNLTQKFGKDVNVLPFSAGLHCVIELENFPPELVMRAAKAAKLPLQEIHSRFHSTKQHRYICYFAGLNESTIESCVMIFAELAYNTST